MKWLTDFLPWRFVVPRKAFFRNIKVARVVPEIRRQINRQAALKLCEYVVMAPILLIGLPILALHAVLDWFLTPGRVPILPDFDRLNRETVEEAWAIVPFEVVKERLGEPMPRILSKKPGQ